MAKTRLDVALVERGWRRRAPPRSAWSWPGWCSRASAGSTSRAMRSRKTRRIDVRGQPHPYVSRGGLKLAKALDHFAIPVAGRIALDVGASTGGFTDCLLQRGVAKVYAIDVGTNQLAWKLRTDPR
jgi:Predicted rRNA methylase